jgi:hypothetical protein
LIHFFIICLCRSKHPIGSQNSNLLSLKLLTSLGKRSVSNHRFFGVSSCSEKLSHFFIYHFIWIVQVINMLSKLEFTFDVGCRCSFKFVTVFVIKVWTKTAFLLLTYAFKENRVNTRFIILFAKAGIHISYERSTGSRRIPKFLHLLSCSEYCIFKHGVRFVDHHVLAAGPEKFRCSSHLD